MSPMLSLILNTQGVLTICQILAIELLSVGASEFTKLNSALCMKSNSYWLGRAQFLGKNAGVGGGGRAQDLR